MRGLHNRTQAKDQHAQSSGRETESRVAELDGRSELEFWLRNRFSSIGRYSTEPWRAKMGSLRPRAVVLEHVDAVDLVCRVWCGQWWKSIGSSVVFPSASRIRYSEVVAPRTSTSSGLLPVG